MSYRDLITYDRLKAADSAKITENEAEPEVRAVIQGVSSLIRSRLGRVVIVEPVTQRFAPHDWTEDETVRGSDVRAYADEQPLVEIAWDPRVAALPACVPVLRVFAVDRHKQDVHVRMRGFTNVAHREVVVSNLVDADTHLSHTPHQDFGHPVFG